MAVRVRGLRPQHTVYRCAKFLDFAVHFFIRGLNECIDPKRHFDYCNQFCAGGMPSIFILHCSTLILEIS